MPSDCSESRPPQARSSSGSRLRHALHRHPRPHRSPGLRPLQALGVVAALLLPPLGPVPGQAEARWRLGVFPVVSFAGYTSHYGSRIGPSGFAESHHGLDIAAPLGTPIRSWWGGRIAEVINDGSCGHGLVIQSGHYDHIYCHLAGSAGGGVYRSGPVQLRRGQAVATGQLIGHVGLSGRTTGPHLHWGVRYGGRWLDPARLLRAMAASRRNGTERRFPT